MIAVFAIGLALASGAVAPPPAPGVEDEITVIARKLGLIRYTLSVSKQGQIQSCTITQSSGDAELDPIVCNSLKACNSKFPFSRKSKKLLPPCLKQEFVWRQNELAAARELKNAQR